MKKERCLAVSCWLLAFGCQKPTANSQPLTTYPVEVKNFTTDLLQNAYVLTPENELLKFPSDGQEPLRYSNKTLGDSLFLDASNPFHLLLFFPEHQTMLTLDRTLNLTSQLNLQQLGYFRAGALGMASDGKLWLYDEAAFRLKKIALDGALAAESGDLSLVLGKSLQPNFLLEKEQLVFLNDPAAGVLVFDAFGQYLKTLDIKGLQDFQVFGDQLVFFQNGALQAFHLQALLQKNLLLPPGVPSGEKMRVEQDRLYVLEKGSLKVYQL